MPHNLSMNDFDLYFGDCYSYLIDSKIPIYIDKGIPKGDGGYDVEITKISNKKEAYKTLKIKFDNILKQISLDPLPIGAINLPSSVYYLMNKSKLPSPWRYRRLFNDHSLKLFDPLKVERELLKSPPIDGLNNFTVLNSWVNNTYVSAQEALENVSQFKRLGQAFSPEYYFGINYKNNSVCLYRGTAIVGRVNQQDKTIELRPSAVPLKESLNEFGLITKGLVR